MDTGGFFAAAVRTEARHRDAAAVHRKAMECRVPLVCSKWIVVETHSLFVARTDRNLALEWLARIPAVVVPVEEGDERAALSILKDHDDKEFTLVDASSFAIMERLGIRHYHSYDRHFRQYGRFTAVTPSMF